MIPEVPLDWPTAPGDKELQTDSDPVYFLKYRNYKVSVSVGCSQAVMVTRPVS